MQIAETRIQTAEESAPEAGAPAAVGARPRVTAAFLVACALFFAAQQACLGLGLHAAASGVLLRESDTLFGWDVIRVVDDMTSPGKNQRSNVHPLFVMFSKPLAWVFHGWLGLAPLTASVWACSIVAGICVVLMFHLLLAWGARLPEASLFAAIFASSSIVLFNGAIPETGIFSICSILLFLLLVSRALNGRRVAWPLWLMSGVAAYGVTISNTPKLLAAFATARGAGKSLARTLAATALFAAAVGAAGAGLTHLVGSSFAVTNDTRFLWPAYRGGTIPGAACQATMNFLFHDVVAPAPALQRVTYFNRRDFPVVSFVESRHTGARAALALVWGAMLAFAVGVAALRPRSGEREALALFAFCVALDIGCFSNYHVPFEGLYLYSAQAVAAAFAPMAFLAARLSALRPGARRAAFAAVTLFAIALAVANTEVFLESIRLAEAGARGAR